MMATIDSLLSNDQGEDQPVDVVQMFYTLHTVIHELWSTGHNARWNNPLLESTGCTEEQYWQNQVQSPVPSYTAILSTGQKDLWASVPNLDFCTDDFSDIAGFFMIVEIFFHDLLRIQKLCLRCWSGSQGCSHSINGWIDLRRVVELDLDVITYAHELPKSHFVYKTLMKSKLRSDFILNIPTTGCFPSLKFLHVTIYLPDKDSICKLFSCCPVLENLKIEGDLSSIDLGCHRFPSFQLTVLRYVVQGLTSFFYAVY
ncbi:FBD-associated F-box protein [Pyrus ussuriensis x Pyrus communis]|uniref:FBD-associated F-box protein n=1 Tax=Pyrus ussuriensis x Pyrus communis TaxID=2448454 RepID=A0A5N5GE21_9ROSA|nr:FBD-associated F-box protein [Pyrus ussuriensis x Pyrus communis]